MEPVTICRTVVFSSEGLRGNKATVVMLTKAPTASCLRRFCEGENTTCLTWREHDEFGVRCFQRGRMIAFCGHGLLAVANFWFLRTGHCPSLRSRTERYATRLDNGSLWLRAPRLYCRKSSLPERCEDWFEPDDAKPYNSAVAGGKHGYRILEWPANTDLRGLRPRFDQMARTEPRSIIATQAFAPAARSQQPWDFSLRYFAPQYGTPEDNATGSANAVLADYWNGRKHSGREGTDAIFRAWQCSKDGGVIMSRVNGSFVEIGGPFHVIETTESGFESADFSTAVRP